MAFDIRTFTQNTNVKYSYRFVRFINELHAAHTTLEVRAGD